MRDNTAQESPPARRRTAPEEAPSVPASLVFGVITGIELSCRNFLFATFLFIGPLVAGVSLGTTVLLLSTAIISAFLALRSRISCVIGTAQHASMAVLLPAFAWVIDAPGLSDMTRVATMLAIIGSTAFLTGLVLWLTGRFQLGWIASVLPYPVAAGFLASSGALLFLWSINVLTTAEGRGVLEMIGADGLPANLSLAVLLAGVLGLLAYRFRLSYLVAICLILFFGIFYGALWLLQIDMDSARQMHLLPQIVAPEAVVRPTLALYGAIDWALMERALPLIAGGVLMNVTGTLLNLNAVEVATRRPVPIDRELEVTGLGNLLIGSFGGAAAYMTSGSSLMAHRLRVGGAALGLAIAGVALVSALLSARIGAFMPLSLASGLLMFIGGSMLLDWGISVRHRLPLGDWLVVVLIVGLTIVAGIMAAIMAGLVISVFSFVVNYARLPVIRRIGTGARDRSTVDRAPEDEAVLAARGAATRILKVQGYLFFGSADRILREVQAAVTAEDLRHVIIDFRDVTGLDSAACAVFLKLRALCRTEGVEVILSTVQPDIRYRLQRSGYYGPPPPAAPSFLPSLDAALEWCEEALLAEAGLGVSGAGLDRALAGTGTAEEVLAALRDRLERVAAAPGDVVIGMGERSTDVFLLDSGRLSVRIPGQSGEDIRVRSVLPGAVVGEAARYLGEMRTANVVADTDAVLFRLSAERLDEIEREEPLLAAAVHRVLARHLAEKLSKTNGVIAGMMS